MNRIALLIAGMTLAISGAADVRTSQESATSNVPVLYRHVGASRGVPYRILLAIALQESGRTVDGQFAPWPWTLNVNGTPARFETRQEAEKALLTIIASGRRNVDIGIAQINYRYNGHLLSPVEDGLDPKVSLIAATNVLLRELEHCETHLGRLDWWCAVERYHSPGPSDAQQARARSYADKVRRHHAGIER